MKFNFASLAVLKRWLSLVLIFGLIYCVFELLNSGVYRFNPQYLVDNSLLKNRDFSVEVQQIDVPKLGVSAYLFEEHSNPIVSVSFTFRQAGASYEKATQNGLTSILASMLQRGAGKYNKQMFQAQLEQKGIEINFSGNSDNFSGNVLFIKKDLNLAARLVNLTLTSPRFQTSELELAKNAYRSVYQSKMKRAASYLYAQVCKILFGNHAYGRNPYGNPDAVKKLTVADLRAFQKQYLALDNLLIGISGDISASEATQLITKMFSGLPKKRLVHSLPKVSVDFPALTKRLHRPSRQDIGYLFAMGPARQDADFYPTYIAAQILFGSSLNSRIHLKAREDEGLTYGVYADLGENDLISYISGEFSATPDKFPRLMSLIAEEWQKLGQKGITEKEFEQTINYMLAVDALRYADIQNISATLVYMQKEQLGLDFLQKRNDYIRNINIEDVNKAARKYFTKDNLRFITAGDSDE